MSLASKEEHSYVGTGPDGHVCVLRTEGNPDGHMVLRGGKEGPNYGEDSVNEALDLLDKAGLGIQIKIIIGNR